MQIFVLKQDQTYDGTQIQPFWAFRTLNILGSSIVIFRGSMRVSKSEMVDLKDIKREEHLGEFLITADDALNFIIEHFEDQPPNLRLMYFRLRILVLCTLEMLRARTNQEVIRKGTDLYFNGGKLNVGIASISTSSGKIHFALNVSKTGAPAYINVTSLDELGIKEDPLNLGKKVAEKYIVELEAIENDICKSQPLK
ncbi:MAG: DUF366 family protein [Candidatus Hermodarchaeota archaeon]